MKSVLIISIFTILVGCGDEAPVAKTENKPAPEMKKEEAKPVEPAKVDGPAEAAPAEAAPAEAAPEAAPATPATAKTGEEVYNSICMSCHQAGGVGIPAVYPPLAGSDWMAKSNETLSKIVLHGLMGEVEVNGQKYNNVMAPWGGSLSDEEVANVLTFVRSSWGNTGAAVTAEEVKAVRDANPGHAPWNGSEL